jgi:DNA invertase Pin-like site-specific DNA recombinase
MAWVSGFERQRLVERTKAGLERARRQGKKLGRPRLSPFKLAAAAQSAASGLSQRGAARKWGISEAALRAYLRAQKSPVPPTPTESHPCAT